MAVGLKSQEDHAIGANGDQLSPAPSRASSLHRFHYLKIDVWPADCQFVGWKLSETLSVHCIDAGYQFRLKAIAYFLHFVVEISEASIPSPSTIPTAH